jgi:ribonuclease P protein component
VQRLKTRGQFQAVLAGEIVARTTHFAMHRAPLVGPLTPSLLSTAGGPTPSKALFDVAGTWLGAMVPKRWAKRAVTRNTIKRQVFEIGSSFEPNLLQSAHLVRLRTAFDRSRYKSATSTELKTAVRLELQQLFTKATTS